MRPWRVSVVLLLATVALAVCFAPGLLATYRLCFQKPTLRPTRAQLEAALQRHANDPQMQFGYALIAVSREDVAAFFKRPGEYREIFGSDPERGWAPGAASEKALAMAPDDPARKLQYAVTLLPSSSGAIEPPMRGLRRTQPEVLTQQEKANLARATTLLADVTVADPQNALAHYLLARAHFAAQAETAAWEEIARAEQADGWSDYDQQAQEAALKLLRATAGTRLIAARTAAAQSQASKAGIPLRYLARRMTTRGHDARAAGDHAQALRMYRSVLVLSQKLRQGTRNAINLISARSFVSMPGGPMLTADARRKLPRTKDTSAWVRGLLLAEAQALSNYATAHGDPKLGQMALTEARASDDAVAAFSAASAALKRDPVTRAGNWAVATARLLPYQAAGLLAVLLVCGLVLLIYRTLGTKTASAPISWSLWIGWLSALVGLLAALATWVHCLPDDIADDMQAVYWVMPRALALLSGLLWSIATGIVSHRRTRALRSEQSKERYSGAATMAALTVASLAALALLALLLLLVAYAAVAHEEQWALLAIQQGELHVLGIR